MGRHIEHEHRQRQEHAQNRPEDVGRQPALFVGQQVVLGQEDQAAESPEHQQDHKGVHQLDLAALGHHPLRVVLHPQLHVGGNRDLGGAAAPDRLLQIEIARRNQFAVGDVLLSGLVQRGMGQQRVARHTEQRVIGVIGLIDGTGLELQGLKAAGPQHRLDRRASPRVERILGNEALQTARRTGLALARVARLDRDDPVDRHPGDDVGDPEIQGVPGRHRQQHDPAHQDQALGQLDRIDAKPRQRDQQLS